MLAAPEKRGVTSTNIEATTTVKMSPLKSDDGKPPFSFSLDVEGRWRINFCQ